MAPTPTGSQNSAPKSMLAYMRDLPNLVTLLGLACGVLALFFAFRANYPAAMIALLWAALCDWYDGPLAARMTGRSPELALIGRELDSLADLVTSGVTPALLLLKVGDFAPLFIPGAILVVLGGAVRLSYFNVFGLKGGTTYQGIPIGGNIVLTVIVFAFRGYMPPQTFSALFYGCVVLMALWNTAPFRFPKLVGRWYYAIAVFVAGLTIFYGTQLGMGAGS